MDSTIKKLDEKRLKKFIKGVLIDLTFEIDIDTYKKVVISNMLKLLEPDEQKAFLKEVGTIE